MSHITLWNYPLATLSFFALLMTVVSFWAHRSWWLWGSFLIITCTLAYQAHFIQPLGFFFLALLMGLHAFFKKGAKGILRSVVILAITLLSLGLWAHYIPGFCNWKIAENLCLSPGAVPYNLWLNFDKPFTGIFVLAFGLPLIQSNLELKKVAKIALPITCIGIGLILYLALSLQIIRFDPKLPTLFFLWLFNNLILVSAVEEIFLRGFLQRELSLRLGSGPLPSACAILAIALLFALLHLPSTSNFPFLALVFAAGIVYGSVYQITKSIESSIFCHFCLNLIHFLFFTYPALA